MSMPSEFARISDALRTCERKIVLCATETEDVELRAQLMDLGAQLARNQCWLEVRKKAFELTQPPATERLEHVAVDGLSTQMDRPYNFPLR